MNNLLANNNEIEKQHFKLWLPSTAVLERLLHNRVFTQSALEAEEIKRHIAMFVKTDALDRSFNLLERSGFCMLTGIPGIGKTTTARLLVARHVFEKWEGVYISSHARDASSVFDPLKKQIFFYDDFLGLTSIRERMSKNEDKELVKLIKACQRNPQRKRLVLTTREYLYEQARQQNEILSSGAGIDASRAIVELKDYTTQIRAQVLVNHLYFHAVDTGVCSEFVQSKAARKTLGHRNYNPRIVEAMCEMQGDCFLTGEEFGAKFLAMLDSPEMIWDHAFRNQLTKNAQHLLLVFAMHGSSVTLDKLKKGFRRHAESAGFELVGFEAMFNGALKELEGTFLSANRQSFTCNVGFHNPSVKDFTDAELRRDGYVLKLAFRNSTFNAVRLFAARLLTENHRGDITAQQCLEAMTCENHPSATHSNNLGGYIVDPMAIRPETALRKWLEIVQLWEDNDVTLRALRVIETFFESAEKHNVEVDAVVDLYSAYYWGAFEF